ncbi:MAG: carboxypeptidase-like regulatory domain-containing protein [Microscillaceae bacterium]|nr:carboxypeptidase-like regulatory domain-containing protein [Microscillaceae bacterium]
MQKHLLYLWFSMCISVGGFAQNTPNDGDWRQSKVSKGNTPEAAWMIRYGDIDNLGFGFVAGFDPFTGKSTEAHPFPWAEKKEDLPGLDRIMLPSSFGKVETPCDQDGYSGEYERLMNQYQKTVFALSVPLDIPTTLNISAARLLMFVDDFQSPVFCSRFEVTLNGRRAIFLENILNALNQTGPVGKLVTIPIPSDFLDVLKAKTLDILIDDPHSGAGDGFAIDFVKILVNPALDAQKNGHIQGILVDADSGNPVVGATVSIPGLVQSQSNEKGEFTLKSVPAGFNVLQVCVPAYKGQTFNVDVVENEITQTTLEMRND